MKIAILGSRGIPAAYGGFETIVETLSRGLCRKGFTVFVSCESRGFAISSYEGVGILRVPILSLFRPFSEVLYDALSLLFASFFCDIVYILGYGSSFFYFIPKLLRRTLIVNPDGLEWKRRKFGRLSRSLLKVAEAVAVRSASHVAADSEEIRKYLALKYRRRVEFLPYGVARPQISASSSLDLAPDSYCLIVARLEPENNIDLMIQEFSRSKTSRQLVIVGDSASAAYKHRLIELADYRVKFLGAIYDKVLLDSIRAHSLIYLHGHEVGGTNPSLLESLASGNAVVALDVPFNREVGGSACLYFSKQEGSLADILDWLHSNPAEIRRLKLMAFNRYQSAYTEERMIASFCRFIDSIRDA